MGDGGWVISIGSINVECMLFVGGVIYVMSKLVLVGLIKGLVCDFGLCGIMVNNV